MKRMLWLTGTAAVALLAHPASGQQATGGEVPPTSQATPPAAPVLSAPNAPAAEQPDQSGIADIVVYAQRRSVGESAQRVPIAITAVDSHLLAATNSVSLQDIGSIAPSVQTGTAGTTPGFPNFTIRGVGIVSSLRSVDPAVNVVQDGMVLAYQAGAVVSTFDLDGLEILRGPQGTLFGRNATGGAISLRTRLPRDSFQALLNVDYGNYNTADVEASVEGPVVSDRVLAKVAFLYRHTDGFIRNTTTGTFLPAPGNPTGQPVQHETGLLGHQNEYIIKPTFLFKLGDSTRLTVFGQYQNYDDAGNAPRNFVPAGAPLVPLQTTYGYYPTYGKYETNILTDGYIRIHEGHVIGQLENEIGPGKLTSILAYRNVSFDSTINLSGGPFIMFYFPDNRENNHQTSFETRYNVDVLRDVGLTAGFYYINSRTHVFENRLQTGPASAPANRIYTRGDFFQTAVAFAGFANIDWKIVDKLQLSVGGRYSTERKEVNVAPLTTCIGQSYSNCPLRYVDSAKRFNDLSPRVVVNFSPTARTLFYASYTKGFRSGNYNSRATSPAGIGPANPEKVTSYEAGTKLDLLARTLRINGAVYQEDYRDIQQVLTANIPGSGPVQQLLNAANARIRGLELEGTALPFRGLQLNAAFGVTDAKYRNFTVAVPNVADPVRLKFQRVPKYTATGAIAYDFKVGALPGRINARVAYDWRSSFFTDLSNTVVLKQNAYGLLNATLSYNEENWSVSVFGRNLGNVDYVDSKGVNVSYTAYGGQPRTYGVRTTLRFR